jgi:hypothetical protein
MDMASKYKAVAELLLVILGKLAPTIVEIISEALDGGKTSAEELRNQPIEVSIAFGGGPGEAIVIQRRIEADLPK